MKIAILTPTFFEYSGIDRVAEQQAIEYSKKKNKVSVITFKSSIRPKGYDIIEIGMPKSLFMQRIYRLFFFLDKIKINKYVKKLKGYDKVISHMYPMNIIAREAKKRYNVKYIFHNHGVGSPKLFKNIFEKLYMKLFILFNNNSLKSVDEAVSISKFMQSELKRESGIKSKVIYNKIDSKKFNKKVNRIEIRKKYGLEDKKVLLFVGRLSPHKGVDILLRAFNIISKEIKDAKLLIVGKPTFDRYYQKLKKLANKDVIFINSVEDKDLPEYYGACDVYVTATLWEGFNLPIAEAQLCNKPVVAFNIGPHKEIVKKGKLVNEKDIKGFSEAVIKILK